MKAWLIVMIFIGLKISKRAKIVMTHYSKNEKEIIILGILVNVII
jgi:hypothetical protein